MSVNPAWRNQHTDLITGHVHKCVDCKRMLNTKKAKRCHVCAARFNRTQTHKRAIASNAARAAKKNDSDCLFLASVLGLDAVADRDRIMSALTPIRYRFSKAKQ